MTQDGDILSPRAADLAEELRAHLGSVFHIAVRVRIVAEGKGYRIFQLREPKNRDLANVRQADQLPPTEKVAEVLVPILEDLIAQKLIGLMRRQGQPKSYTDGRDIKVLLLAFPELKREVGAVADRLHANAADAATMEAWQELANLDLPAPDDDAGY
jgi:hypothetical protein